MGITTKKGDKGSTGLLFGGRISKDDIRIESLGAVDELCAFLGFSRSLIFDTQTNALLKSIQEDLFLMGSELAVKPAYVGRLEKRITQADVKLLEKAIVCLEAARTFEECCFFVSGESTLSSSLDIARTVARRAERHAVTLKRRKGFSNGAIVMYLNRLSDLLYLLARAYEKTHSRGKRGRTADPKKRLPAA